MTNLFIIFVFIALVLILKFFIFIYKKLYPRSAEVIRFKKFIKTIQEEECNPDINTKNWDLHKRRLDKYRRSQYKGLTFFLNSQDRIFYINENGIKIYC